jgi:predicted transcriptional regulator
MSSTFTVRVDDRTEQELAALVERGGSRNAVISEAVHALYRQRILDQVRRETAALAADPDELSEIRKVQEDLEDLRAW